MFFLLEPLVYKLPKLHQSAFNEVLVVIDLPLSVSSQPAPIGVLGFAHIPFFKLSHISFQSIIPFLPLHLNRIVRIATLVT